MSHEDETKSGRIGTPVSGSRIRQFMSRREAVEAFGKVIMALTAEGSPTNYQAELLRSLAPMFDRPSVSLSGLWGLVEQTIVRHGPCDANGMIAVIAAELDGVTMLSWDGPIAVLYLRVRENGQHELAFIDPPAEWLAVFDRELDP